MSACSSSDAPDRGDDSDMGTTAAKIAAHIFAYFILGFRMTFLETGDRRHGLAGRAIAALKPLVIEKRLLHKMQLSARNDDTFNCGDLLAPRLHCQRQAGQHPPAVDVGRACTTWAVVTAFFCTVEPNPLAQGVKQRRAGPSWRRCNDPSTTDAMEIVSATFSFIGASPSGASA
jgi:hypothetical protein